MTMLRMRRTGDERVMERARRSVADRGVRRMLEAARADHGSCENAARWDMLEATILWCALTLGVHRALRVVEHADRSHRALLAYYTVRSRVSRRWSSTALEFNTRLALGTLRLCAISVPREQLRRIIERGIHPSGARPPWLSPRLRGRVLFASALDQAVAEREQDHA